MELVKRRIRVKHEGCRHRRLATIWVRPVLQPAAVARPAHLAVIAVIVTLVSVAIVMSFWW
jgi:hypothetical protein